MQKEENQKEITLEEIFLLLLKNSDFYAFLFSGFKKVESKECPTMAVVFNPRAPLGLELHYNPEFLKKIIRHKFLYEFVIAHEGYHIIGKVYERLLNLEKTEEKIEMPKYLIASDLAANSILLNTKFIDEKSKIREKLEICVPKHYNLPEGLTLEQYYDALEGVSLSTTHQYFLSILGKLSSEEKDLLRIKIEDKKILIKDAIESFRKIAGIFPGELSEIIESYLSTSIPWGRYLQACIRSGVYSKRKRSIRRLKRRTLGIPELANFPGARRIKTYKIANIIDTSGSMSHWELRSGLSTCYSLFLHDPTMVLYLVQADVDIQKVTQIKSNHDLKKIEMKGRGGTDFKNPIEYCLKHIKPDLIVYFTDGYGEAPESAPPVPIIWCLTSKTSICDPTGKEISYGKCLQIKNP